MAASGLADQTLGFNYHDSHDLIGFEDGSANPKGDARSGVYDHLLDYSRAVSGSYWFVPARADLDQMIR